MGAVNQGTGHIIMWGKTPVLELKGGNAKTENFLFKDFFKFYCFKLNLYLFTLCMNYSI